jgi:tetratricopeptide repeat protein
MKNRLLALLAVGSLLATAGQSWAQAKKTAAVAEQVSPSDAILDEMEAGRFSAALRKAAELSKKHPNDSQVRYLTGLTLMTTMQYKEAVGELEKTIELKPDFAEAYGNLGLVYDLIGEEEKAYKNLKKSLELDPDNPDTKRDFSEVVIRSRIRKGQKKTLNSDTAAYAMQGFISMLEKGDMEEAFEQYVEMGIIRKIMNKAGGRSGLRDFYRGMSLGWNAQVLKGGGKYLGFEVQPPDEMAEADETTGKTKVLAYALIEKMTTAEDAARMKRFMNSPELAEFVSPDIRAVIEGLEQQDRAALFDRQVGLRQNQLLPIHFICRKDSKSKWRIEDALIGHSDLVQISIMDALDKMAAFAEITEPGSSYNFSSKPYRSSRSYSHYIGIAVGVFVLISFFLRRNANK